MTKTPLFEGNGSFVKCVLCSTSTVQRSVHFGNVLIHAQRHLKQGDAIVIGPNSIEVLVAEKEVN